MDFTRPSKTEKRSAGIVDLDYTVLLARDTLPSKGKFYPEPYVYVRGLRFREQLEAAQISKMVDQIAKKLEAAQISQEEVSKEMEIPLKSAHRLHSHCVEIPNVPFENILSEDLVVLSMWVTFLTSSATKFQVTVECEHCKKKLTTSINTDTLEMLDFELFELQTVETDLGTLIIGPKTVGEDELFSLLENVPKKLFHAPMIKKHNGKDLTIDERVELLGLLSVKDALKIINICDKMTSGMKPIVRTCKECGKETRVYPYIDIIRGLP